MPELIFPIQGLSLQVPAGISLLDAARLAGIPIESPCNSEGTCGKCRVLVHEEDRASIHVVHGRHRLTEAEVAEGFVLGCLAHVHGDARIDVPLATQQKLSIVTDGKRRHTAINPWIGKRYDPDSDGTIVTAGGQTIGVEAGNTAASLFGLAVDLGTTTVVASLVDLDNGRQLGSASALNPQARHAQDILSRIKLSSTPEGMELLHGELMRELNRLIDELALSSGIGRSAIYEVVLSGNTAMLTIAAALSPASLGKYPFRVELPTPCSLPAIETGIRIAEYGRIWLPPVASAYIGADIVSGVLASDLSQAAGVTLFIDIGTNGEMVLSQDGRLSATSTAAGPAFEGMNISSGMRAASGAIERVALGDGNVDIQVIGDGTPVGLCGSGLLDAVAELARRGLLDRNGRFTKPGSEGFEAWRHHFDTIDGRTRFKISENVGITQQDIRQVQLAKAAIRAGIDMMLGAGGVAPEAVDRVFIAGSFGMHLRVSSLVGIGLLPESLANRVEFLGNTSMSGAVSFLLDRDLRDQALATVERMEVLELSREPDFEKVFLKSIAFPQPAATHNEIINEH
ncbi:MAG: DUF4445 domain-containing protein [Chlorobiaceae bacterium]|nr:DUF4445 domain-containing protein [Chlorobiaceae bacterium]